MNVFHQFGAWYLTPADTMPLAIDELRNALSEIVKALFGADVIDFVEAFGEGVGAEHRIDNQGDLFFAQLPGHHLGYLGGVDHPGLDRIDPEIVEDGIQLCFDDACRDRMDGRHPLCVL